MPEKSCLVSAYICCIRFGAIEMQQLILSILRSLSFGPFKMSAQPLILSKSLNDSSFSWVHHICSPHRLGCLKPIVFLHKCLIQWVQLALMKTEVSPRLICYWFNDLERVEGWVGVIVGCCRGQIWTPPPPEWNKDYITGKVVQMITHFTTNTTTITTSMMVKLCYSPLLSLLWDTPVSYIMFIVWMNDDL